MWLEAWRAGLSGVRWKSAMSQVPITLISYGARRATHPTGLMRKPIDVRGFANPYHNERLRSLRGTDAPVQRELLAHAPFRELVFRTAFVIVPGDVVGAYCNMGRHRSVAFVECVAKWLRRWGHTVVIVHWERATW